MTTDTLWPGREARQLCVDLIAHRLYWRHGNLHEAGIPGTMEAYRKEAEGLLALVETEMRFAFSSEPEGRDDE